MTAPDCSRPSVHLADSLPRAVLQRLSAQTDRDAQARRRRIAALLDAGHGARWLRWPEVGALVDAALPAGDGTRYRLLAWAVMPNHVHVPIETLPGLALAEVVRGWKGATARAANEVLGRWGAFWQRDYFDRFVRDYAHLAAVVRYIEQNPVTAGLVERAEAWAFSSAVAGSGD